MISFPPGTYVENIKRLAFGLEPIDSVSLMRIAPRLQVIHDDAARNLPRPKIDRHSSCLHVLIFGDDVTTPLAVRLFEEEYRFVPRRIEYPFNIAANSPVAERMRRPLLFPGCNYDLDSGATGLRGRVLRGGSPMRWARVEANIPGAATPFARAHGDDRGEFLLVLPPDTNFVTIDPTWPIDVTVFGPAATPVPATPDLPGIDPLWDLPLEVALAPDQPDTVSPGAARPTGYTVSRTQTIGFVPGRVISQVTFTIV